MQVLNEKIFQAPMVRTVAYGERLAAAPRRVLDAVLCWHATLRQQHTAEGMLTGAEQVVWAEGWDEVPPLLGALVWSEQEDGSWWVDVGFVLPTMRKHGIYKLLWETCVYQAQKANVKLIQGSTANDNTDMQEVMRKLGRRCSYLVYDYEVPSA